MSAQVLEQNKGKQQTSIFITAEAIRKIKMLPSAQFCADQFHLSKATQQHEAAAQDQFHLSKATQQHEAAAQDPFLLALLALCYRADNI